MQNDEAMVRALLERLGVDGGVVFSVEGVNGISDGQSRLLQHLNWPCSLHSAFLVSFCRDANGFKHPSVAFLLGSLLKAHCKRQKQVPTKFVMLHAFDSQMMLSAEAADAKARVSWDHV